jgi:hypothetical protein
MYLCRTAGTALRAPCSLRNSKTGRVRVIETQDAHAVRADHEGPKSEQQQKIEHQHRVPSAKVLASIAGAGPAIMRGPFASEPTHNTKPVKDGYE